MNARAVLKSTAPVIAHYSGIGKALALRYGGPGVIFMLHSTVDDAGAYLEDRNTLSRCGARTDARAGCRNNGVDFVSLDEAVERLGGPSGRQILRLHF